MYVRIAGSAHAPHAAVPSVRDWGIWFLIISSEAYAY